MMSKALPLLLLALAATTIQGCSSSAGNLDYETIRGNPTHDTAAAQQNNEKAVKLIEQEEYDKAESLLKKALAVDITFGAAHNNLGKIYHHQSKLYLAAWEFQYAIKLMPNQPEPRNNLGLVFEAVGKLDDAVTAYGQALELEPDNPQLMGNLARARVRRGDRDDSLRNLLSNLIMRETRPEWLTWARQKHAMMGANPDPALEPGNITDTPHPNGPGTSYR